MPDLPSIEDLIEQSTGASSASVSVNGTKKVGERFDKKMEDIKKKELEAEAMRRAQASGYPHINLEKFPISQEALRQIPFETAKELGAVCFFATPDEVRVGALDPSREGIAALVEEITGRLHAEGGLYVISEPSFAHVLKLYETLPIVKAITKDVEVKPEDLTSVQANVKDFASFQELLTTTKTSDLMTIILGAALKLDASDVHVEAEEKQIVVRFRLDGVLHDAATISKEMFGRLISRVKLVSSLKINITDKPQDGRFTIKMPAGDVDVRVSIMPTVFGESAVLRLLHQSQGGIELSTLGFRPRQLAIMEQEARRPNGMIITTGPTGSGKSTTLYAVVNIVNKPGVKIITLEDPVEYRIQGVNQSQIDTAKGYTFAKGLRSMLRQDPDIVMVGEIRDLETAEIAIQASLTGHLMLSTIHTNNAAGAIPRFLSMGVKPFLLGPALNCIVGQRLVRRLCSSCKKELPLEKIESHMQETVSKLLGELPEQEKKEIEGKPRMFYTAGGCDACGSIGYKGRVGIYEVFTVDGALEDAIVSDQVTEHSIEDMARAHGMATMAQDGLLKALEGITSVEEVFRVSE